jgi:hypothetical protein
MTKPETRAGASSPVAETLVRISEQQAAAREQWAAFKAAQDELVESAAGLVGTYALITGRLSRLGDERFGELDPFADVQDLPVEIIHVQADFEHGNGFGPGGPCIALLGMTLDNGDVFAAKLAESGITGLTPIQPTEE